MNKIVLYLEFHIFIRLFDVWEFVLLYILQLRRAHSLHFRSLQSSVSFSHVQRICFSDVYYL